MTHILGKFGVPANEKSPFCCSFETPKDLMNALIKFLPHTFSYPDVSGASSQPSAAINDVEEATQAEEASQGTHSNSVLEKIGKFARQMAKASDDKVEDEDEEDDNGGKDSVPSEEVTPPVVIDENKLQAHEGENSDSRSRAKWKILHHQEILREEVCDQISSYSWY